MCPLGVPIKPTTYAKISLSMAGFVNLPNPISISHIPGLLIILKILGSSVRFIALICV